MVNSGTGHDRCPSVFPGPSGAREPPCGGNLEITKTVFGFKRSQKFFALIWIALPGRYGRAGRGALTALPFAVSYLQTRRTARSNLCFCFSQRAFSACERFCNAARSAAWPGRRSPARFDRSSAFSP